MVYRYIRRARDLYMTVSHFASLAATLGNYRQMTGVESTTSTSSSSSSRETGTTLARLCDISGDHKHGHKKFVREVHCTTVSGGGCEAVGVFGGGGEWGRVRSWGSDLPASTSETCGNRTDPVTLSGGPSATQTPPEFLDP